MSKGFFVTGTDTGVGKTLITAGLLCALGRRGIKVAGMKPVACGCKQTKQGLRNEDALLLEEHTTVDIEYDIINPYAYEPPVSPHFAATVCGRPIRLDTIIQRFRQIEEVTDRVIVEGVGGWRVPINDEQDISEVAIILKLPVILVVGLRLGCINHALLTAKAVQEGGLNVIACVASLIDPEYQNVEGTLITLEKRLKVTVDLVPWKSNCQPEQITHYLKQTTRKIYETV